MSEGNVLIWSYTGLEVKNYAPRKMWVAISERGTYAIWEHHPGPHFMAWFTRVADHLMIYLGTSIKKDSALAVAAAKATCEKWEVSHESR